MEMDTDTPVPPPAATTAPASASAPASAPPSVSASSPSTPAEPRRRNRPALSCIQCRTRKIRCDRMEPCGSCLKSKIVNCMYEEARRPKPRLWRLSPAQDPDSPASDDHFPRHSSSSGPHHLPRLDTLPSSNAAGMQYAHSAAALPILGSSGPTSMSTPAPSAAAPAAPTLDAELLRDRIRGLEKQLADVLWGQDQGRAHQPPASHPVQTSSAPDPAPAPAPGPTPKPAQPEVGHKPRPKFVSRLRSTGDTSIPMDWQHHQRGAVADVLTVPLALPPHPAHHGRERVKSLLPSRHVQKGRPKQEVPVPTKRRSLVSRSWA